MCAQFFFVDIYIYASNIMVILEAAICLAIAICLTINYVIAPRLSGFISMKYFCCKYNYLGFSVKKSGFLLQPLSGLGFRVNLVDT